MVFGVAFCLLLNRVYALVLSACASATEPGDRVHELGRQATTRARLGSAPAGSCAEQSVVDVAVAPRNRGVWLHFLLVKDQDQIR